MKKWLFVAGAAAVGVGAVIGVSLYKKAKADALLSDFDDKDIVVPKKYATVPPSAKPAVKQEPFKSASAPEARVPAADMNVKNGEKKDAAKSAKAADEIKPKDEKPEAKTGATSAAVQMKARRDAKKNAPKDETKKDSKKDAPVDGSKEEPKAAAEGETQEVVQDVPASEDKSEEPKAE